jgi:hypothetical protein
MYVDVCMSMVGFLSPYDITVLLPPYDQLFTGYSGDSETVVFVHLWAQACCYKRKTNASALGNRDRCASARRPQTPPGMVDSRPGLLVSYESTKRELKRRLINEGRFDEMVDSPTPKPTCKAEAQESFANSLFRKPLG